MQMPDNFFDTFDFSACLQTQQVGILYQIYIGVQNNTEKNFVWTFIQVQI